MDSNERNIQWHHSNVTPSDRAQLLKHRGAVVWFTGLSGSGKSTIASAVAQDLHQRGKLSYLLDGDNVRHGLNHDLGFSSEDRIENIRRVAEVAKLFWDAGLIVLVSFISPFRAERELARNKIGDAFFEVHVDAPLEICEQRDPKGLYQKAREGLIQEFTGISSPYEPPEKPELRLQSHQITLAESVSRVHSMLEQAQIV